MSLYLYPLSKHPQILSDAQFVTGVSRGETGFTTCRISSGSPAPRLGQRALSLSPGAQVQEACLSHPAEPRLGETERHTPSHCITKSRRILGVNLASTAHTCVD